MKLLNLLLLIFLIALTGCNFESAEEDSSGGGLFNNHQEVENAFTFSVPESQIFVESQNITIIASHGYDLTVTGTPQISIDIGGSTVNALYTSGSGTEDLTFKYSVQTGDLDTDGIQISEGIDLNGGTIKFTVAGVTTDADVDTVEVPSTDEIYVDAVAPVLSLVTPPTQTTYYINEQLTFFVTFDSVVEVTGTPQITIDVGGVSKTGNYLSGSGTQNLVFALTVESGDIDVDGITMSSPLVLNSGTIKDIAGNNSTLSFTPAAMATTFIDGESPVVDSLTLPANSTYFLGEIVSLEVEFNEIVNISGGTPSVEFNIDGTVVEASYFSGSGTTTLKFRYIVTQGFYDTNGIEIADTIKLNGALIQDSSLANAKLTLTPGLTPSILVDSRIPEIITVTAPADNIYLTDENLDFTFEFDEAVTVTNIPRVQVALSSGNVYAEYFSGSGSTVLTFRYVATDSDMDHDGVLFISPILDLNTTGTITGIITSNSAELGFTGLEPTMTEVKVNYNPPTKLAFSVEPVDSHKDQSISPSVVVHVQDTSSNLVATADNNITLSFGTDPSSGTANLGGTLTATAVAGVATFNDLTIDQINTGYTLTATTPGLTDATSNSFDVSQAPATQVVFTQSPTDAIAGAVNTPSITVELRDTYNNLVTDETSDVTLSFGTDPSSGGATIGGTVTVSAVAGVASFNDITIDNAQSGYTLVATSGALTTDTSSAFNISPDVKAQLSFSINPINTEYSVNISPSIEVEIQDAFGNKTNDTDTITLTIDTDPTAGTANLAGTLSVSATAGSASFTDINIDTVGTGFTLEATSPGLSSGASAQFDIQAGAATQIIITQDSNDTLRDAVITPSITAEIRDVANNLVTTSSATVVASFGTDPSSGSANIGGTISKAAVAGIVTFDDITIDTINTGYTLSLDSTGLATATTSSFEILEPTPTQLEFTSQPSNTVAGEVNTTSIIVELRDVNNNLVSNATNDVTLSIGTDPSSGIANLGGTLTVSAVAGVATFNDITIDKAFSSYSLTASSPTITDDTSSSFNITPALKSQIVFNVEPINTEYNTLIAPSIEVEFQDAYGNKTADTDTVTLSIDNNPSAGTLSGTLSLAAINGTATFNDLEIDNIGSNYSLSAAAAGLTSVTSQSFNIISTPTQLAITQEPSNSTNGNAITPAMTIEIRDAANNLVTDSTASITLSFSTDPSAGAASISGTVTVNAVAGVATFNDIEIDTVDNGYTFDFSSAGLTSATSAAFNITQAPATQLAFIQNPSDAIAGEINSPDITVEIQDANGNIVTTSTDSISLALNSDPSSGAATLGGTVTVSAVAGIATFNTITLDKAFNTYSLDATAAGLTTTTSSTFNITPAAKTQLAFNVEPTNAEYDVNINPTITVEIQDAFGNKTNDTDSVTLSINSNPGTSTLSGTLSQNAVAGVASFNDINLDKVGDGYTLDATATGLTTTTSGTFNIIAIPTQLIITQGPSDSTNGFSISPSMTVELRDASNNLVTNATNIVTVSFATDASSGSGTLGGTLSRTAVAGIVTFDDIEIDYVANGYTLDFSSPGLTLATTSSFNITQSTPTQLAFTAQPNNAVAGTVNSPDITVELRDANGNLVPNATDSVTLVFGTDPSSGSASIGGAITKAAVAGVVTFNDITVDKAFNGYTFAATGVGLTQDTSTSFNISPAAKSDLSISVQPTDTTYGVAISPSIEVEIHDAFGNKTTDTDTITLSINSNPNSGTLAGTLTRSATSGTAVFDDINIDNQGIGYSLNVTAAGLTSTITDSFNISTTPTQLVITQSPTNTIINESIAPSITVEIRDASNNLDITANNNITLTLGTDPSSGTAVLGGTKTVTASGGVAIFNNISIDTVNSGYTLIASSPGLTDDTSASFDITTSAELSYQVTSEYDFGQLASGGTDDVTILINHTGSSSATSVTETTLGGAFAFKGGSYPGTGGTCGTSIGSNCTVVVQYTTGAAGVDNGTITLSYYNGETTVNIARDLTGESISVTPTSLSVSGPPGVITNECVPYIIYSVDGDNSIANTSSNETVYLVINNGTGGFYSDAACSSSISNTSITSGTSSKTVYFESSAGSQSLTLIFNGTTLNNTSKAVNTSLAPIKIIASISPEITVDSCKKFEVSLVDTNGVKTGSSSAELVDISQDGSATVYSDSFCTGGLTQLSFSQYEATKNIYIKNSVAESITLTLSDNASVLTTHAPSIDFVSSLTWWDNDYSKRVNITLNNLDQASTFTNIPVLVRLDSSKINYSDLLANGDDIRFTLGDHTTTLSYEIDTWNSSGTSFIWVKVPSVLASSEMSIYMYYSYGAATNNENSSNVWASFDGFWGMNKSGSDWIDSTGTGKDATEVGTVTQTTGPIGNAASFGGSDSLDTGYDLAQIIGKSSTFSFWAKTTQVGDNTNWRAPGITGIEEAGGGNDIFFGFIRADGTIAVNSGNSGVAASNFVVNDNTWRYVTISRDESTGVVQFFVNGVKNGSGTSESGYKSNAFTEFGVIADTGGSPNYYNGELDGIRLITGVQSDDRIKAEYKYSVETHLSYGSPEDL